MFKPETVYSERIEKIDQRLHRLKRIELVLSLLKLAFVSGGIFFLFRIALNYTKFALFAFFFFLAAFVIAALVHEHYIRKRNFQRILSEINADEIQACQGMFLDYGDGGEFEDPDHNWGFSAGGAFSILSTGRPRSWGKKCYPTG